jgi:predicted N-acyltransferase
MLEARVSPSIVEIGRERWDGCFPGELERYDYLLAVERSGLAGFGWRYAVVEEDGRLLAAMPAFQTDYQLETTLVGPGKRIAAGLRKLLPDALTLRLACLGSPCTETAMLGIAPDVPAETRPFILRALLAGFEAAAKAERCGLVAIKDVPQPDQALWDQAARPLGYRPIGGLPVAHLDIDFASLEAYLARLSPATRKDMRRKLRTQAAVRIEVRHDIADVLPQIMALYRETRGRADMAFEDLTPAYFTGVLAGMGEAAFCVLYYIDEDLVAANLLLADETTLLDKFFCMNAERGRAHNLYFLSWFTNVRLCLERGLSRYQSGQAAYANKLRLGSALTPTAMYFRHRNLVLNSALQLVAPLFAADVEPARRSA